MCLGDTPLLDQVVRPLLPIDSFKMVSVYWDKGEGGVGRSYQVY